MDAQFNAWLALHPKRKPDQAGVREKASVRPTRVVVAQNFSANERVRIATDPAVASHHLVWLQRDTRTIAGLIAAGHRAIVLPAPAHEPHRRRSNS